MNIDCLNMQMNRGMNMLLTIKSNAPDWWEVANKPRTISQWWDGMEWQQYRTPAESMVNCAPIDLKLDLICHMDKDFHYVAEGLGMDWAYKFINHSVDIVMSGVSKELENLSGVVQSWIF